MRYNIIDLSVPLLEDTYMPGHPATKFAPIHVHDVFGRSNTQIISSLHVGTHVDSPFHFHPDLPMIDKVPLTTLVGPGVVIRLKGKIEPNELISLEKIKSSYNNNISLENKAVLIYTGWLDEYYKSPSIYYSQNPAPSKEAAEWFVSQKVRLVFLDMPPDKGGTGGPKHGDAPIHRTLLGAQIPLVENVANMSQLDKDEYFVVAAPIKVSADGGLARVFAIDGLQF